MSAYETWKSAYPLHAAAQLGDIELMSQCDITLLINSRDNEKWTPLHYCCFEGHSESIEWLIKNGADLSIGNHFGSTPLHLLIGTGNLNAVKVLLNFVDGKNKDILLIKNEDKHIPRQMLMIADCNQKEIRAALDQKEAQLNHEKL
jgi:ankyrin repeat protein